MIMWGRIDSCARPFTNGEVSLPGAYKLTEATARRYGMDPVAFKKQVDQRIHQIASDPGPPADF